MKLLGPIHAFFCGRWWHCVVDHQILNHLKSLKPCELKDFRGTLGHQECHDSRDRFLQGRDKERSSSSKDHMLDVALLDWVAAKKLDFTYHIGETLGVTAYIYMCVYTHYGNLI